MLITTQYGTSQQKRAIELIEHDTHGRYNMQIYLPVHGKTLKQYWCTYRIKSQKEAHNLALLEMQQNDKTEAFIAYSRLFTGERSQDIGNEVVKIAISQQ